MKILVAVAWPYVNGDIHIGHMPGYLLPADIFARFQRLKGNDVLMVSGSDCHGTPITVQADKEGISAQEIVNKYHKKVIDLFNLYNLSYNLYTKTTTQNHKELVQQLFMELLQNDYLVKGIMKQYYSALDNKFLPDRYVEGICPHCKAKDQRSDQCEVCGRWLSDGELILPKSKLTGAKVELKNSEHYFFDFNKCEAELSKYLATTKDIWKKWVWNEASGWLKEGLKKRAITRDLDWGIELPIEAIRKLPPEKQLASFDGKRIYVWFEAVAGYLTASVEWSKRISGEIKGEENEIIFSRTPGQTIDWKNFWFDKTSKHYYFMGQDNLVFHTLMWPGELLGSGKGYTLPYDVVVNKFMNYEGKKFSKSRNWTIDSAEIARSYGVDAVRYYAAANLPENKEANFTWRDFVSSVNDELVANLGNFIHRTLTFIGAQFGGIIPEGTLENEISFHIRDAFVESGELLDNVKLVDALERIFELVAVGNKYFAKKEAWKVVKEDRNEAGKILYNCVQIISALKTLLYPFIPSSMDRLAKMLGQEPMQCQVAKDEWRSNEVKAGQKLVGIEILFQKIDPKVIENEKAKVGLNK